MPALLSLSARVRLSPFECPQASHDVKVKELEQQLAALKSDNGATAAGGDGNADEKKTAAHDGDGDDDGDDERVLFYRQCLLQAIQVRQ